MNCVRAAIPQAARLLGKQRKSSDSPLRFSKYCMQLPVDQGTLLYHTLTGELLFMGHEERLEDCADKLEASWFLVPENFDEQKQTDDLRRLSKLFAAKKNRNHFTILTTTDCNARCYYCFEVGLKRQTMTTETARDTAEYISKVCGDEKVHIKWFGGEPLYNREAIEVISKILQEKNIPFTSEMLSNGYYFDAATAKTAVQNWNLKKLQITLDGTKEVYRRTKAYLQRDEDPLSRVFDHIESALQAGIKVSIRLNMNRQNAEDLMTLADVLNERFPHKQNLNVYVSILKEFVAPVHAFEAENELKEKALALRKRLVELGLHKTATLPKELRCYHCMADQDTREAIMPDGSIVTCDQIKSAERLGDIFKTERDRSIAEAWKETVCSPSCKNCPLYPRCIRLKKCPWETTECSPGEQAVKMLEMKDSVLAYFRAWKEERTESDTAN